MNSHNWLARLVKKLFGFEDRFSKKQKLNQYYRPQLECMEERVVPAAPGISVAAGPVTALEQIPTTIDNSLSVTDDGSIVSAEVDIGMGYVVGEDFLAAAVS